MHTTQFPPFVKGDRGDFRNEAIFIVKHYVKHYLDVALIPVQLSLTVLQNAHVAGHFKEFRKNVHYIYHPNDLAIPDN